MTLAGTHLISLAMLTVSTHLELTRAMLARKERRVCSAEDLDAVEWGCFVVRNWAPDESLQPPGRDAHIRVATWNIERGVQYDKIVQAFKHELADDIYLLQEVDAYARRTGYKNVARSLARELEMDYVFGIEFQELAQGGAERPALHGQAILSRFPITQARVLRFVHQPKDWSHDLFQPRHGGRMALVAEIRTPAGKLIVYDAHLESRGDENGRARQMEEILSDIATSGYREPVLIAGDLNTKNFPSPVIEGAQRFGFTDVLLSSNGDKATSGKKRLDWSLTKGLATVSTAIHSRVRASDHTPVSAEVEFKNRTEIYSHRW